MWTRKDIDDFKEAIRKEGGDSIIKVGHGETVTVRVPTHEDGTCLFWEFATNSYDLGFGLYFEWSKSETSQVSVHVSESEDDEEDDYEEGRSLSHFYIPIFASVLWLLISEVLLQTESTMISREEPSVVLLNRRTISLPSR